MARSPFTCTCTRCFGFSYTAFSMLPGECSLPLQIGPIKPFYVATLQSRPREDEDILPSDVPQCTAALSLQAFCVNASDSHFLGPSEQFLCICALSLVYSKSFLKANSSECSGKVGLHLYGKVFFKFVCILPFTISQDYMCLFYRHIILLSPGHLVIN